jgi:hypothetical protein
MEEAMVPIRENLRIVVLFLIGFHHGRDQALSRDEFLHQIHSHGFDVDERELRIAIHDLKKDGHLIVSSGGSKGGYWLATGWNEVDEYLEREVRARALDLLEQERIFLRAAAIEFGPKPVPNQLALMQVKAAPSKSPQMAAMFRGS